MGFENKYPYTDFHELNLDWILEVVKRIETEWPEFKTTLETEWNDYKDGLTGEGGEWPTFKTQIETIVNNFIHDVVGQYNGNINYQLGMFCYYEGNVYRCTQISTAAYPRPFSSYGWFSYAGQNTNSIVNDLFNYLTTALSDQDNKIYYWIQHTAAQWDETTAYKAGDYCSSYVGGVGTPFTWRYYRCLQDCTNVSIFNTNYWKEVIFASDVAETIAAYKQAMQDQYDEFLEDYQRTFGVVQVRGSSTTDVMSQKAVSDELQAIDNQIQAIDNQLQVHDDMIDNLINDIAPEYDSTKPYKIGILLSYQGKMYYCIADAPAGTLPTNTEYFEEKSVADIIEMIKNGSIVTGHSEVADNLTPYSEDSGTTQEEPFISQGTGTDNNSVIVTTGVIAKQLEKQGNTVANNQLARAISQAHYTAAACASFTFATNKFTFVASQQYGGLYQDADKLTLTAGHTYLAFATVKTTTATDKIRLQLGSGSVYSTATTSAQTLVLKTVASTSSSTFGTLQVSDTRTSDWDSVEVSNVKVIDLTQYFNGNSNIPQDLLAHPEHFSWYYNGSLAYDAGSLQNCNGRYLECGQGRQLWDEIWENGRINIEDGGNTSATGIRSKNHIFVIPNRPIYIKSPEYCFIVEYDANKQYVKYGNYFKDAVFTPSANTQYIRFYCTTITTYSNNITFSLYYSPEEGGEGYNQHYGYVAPIRIDTGNETLKAFDKKLPSGVIGHNTGETNLGDLTWIKYEHPTLGTYFYAMVQSLGIKHAFDFSKAYPFVCAKYVSVGRTDTAFVDKTLCADGDSTTVLQIQVKDSSYATAADFKTAMSGVMLQFELANPTTEQGTPFSEYAPINDYSYMAWFDTDGNLVSIPQGCKLFYPVDYKGFTDDLVMYTNGDATALAKNEDITDIALAERGYNKTSDLFGVFGSKETAGGILRHLLITNATGLDFANTKYIDLGSLTWTYYTSYKMFYATISDIKQASSGSTTANAICPMYKTVSKQTLENDVTLDMVVAVMNSQSNIEIRNLAYTDATTFKNAVKGMLFAYEKAST